MRPKPISLRLILVYPHQGEAFLLLRLFQGNWKADIPVAPEALETLLNAAVVEAGPVLHGILKRRPDGGWRISGKDLELLHGLSPGVGPLGEYLHADEVKEGEVLEVWTFPMEQKEFVGTFRTKARWHPPAQVEEQRGQRGDLALFRGEIQTAREHYQELAQRMVSSGKVDAAWVSKLTLSSLLSDLAGGEDEKAHATWLGRSEDPLLRLGITTLESGQTSDEDALLYQQVAAYFHSLNPQVDKAGAAVDKIMKGVFEACPVTDRYRRRLILNNWFLFQKEIYEGQIPERALEKWSECRKQYSGPIHPKAICFPPPHPWVIDWEHEGITTVTPTSESRASRRPSLCLVLALVAVAVLFLFSFDGGGNESSQVVRRAPRREAAPPSQRTAVASNSRESELIETPTPSLKSDSILAGTWTVAGVVPNAKQRVDRGEIEGFRVVGMGPTWARLENDEAVLLVGLTHPAKFATGYQSEVLFVDGQKVVEAGTTFSEFKVLEDELGSESLAKRSGVRALEGLDGRVYFVHGSLDAPMPGQVSCTGLLNALDALDLDTFKSELDAEKANIIWNDGKSMLEKTVGYRAKRTPGRKYQVYSYVEFCRALIEAGADVAAHGEKAFWRTSDWAVLEVLLDAGVDVNCRNDTGRTKLFHSSKELYEYLISRGADPTLKDNDGLDVAAFKEQLKQARLKR